MLDERRIQELWVSWSPMRRVRYVSLRAEEFARRGLSAEVAPADVRLEVASLAAERVEAESGPERGDGPEADGGLGGEEILSMRIGEALAGRRITIYSEVLGREVVLSTSGGKGMYSAGELLHLVAIGASADMLRTVDAVKVIFGGSVVGAREASKIEQKAESHQGLPRAAA